MESRSPGKALSEIVHDKLSVQLTQLHINLIYSDHGIVESSS